MMTLADIRREARFLFRQRQFSLAIVALFLLTSFAIYSGIAQINQQHETIARLIEKDTLDRQLALSQQSDYGSAAYYSFHLTYSTPSSTAFTAIGQRDVLPWKHRIRMLAIEGQIYESDQDNPELSLIGRFDYAFVVSILMPLFIILLLHDLRANEKQAGRYELLVVSATHSQSPWLSRAFVVWLTVALSVIFPLIVGALIHKANLVDSATIALLVLGHCLFWVVLSLFVASLKSMAQQHSARIAATLLGVWIVFTILIPVTSNVIIQNSINSPQGSEILLTQREAVNDAWDLPVEATWQAFLERHPKWLGKTAMNSQFEWKWYYAFQQVGDQQTEALSHAYRDASIRKDELASYVALLSPPLLCQRWMSHIAKTDTQAMLNYEQQVRDFHRSLREFYYPLMFNQQTYSVEKLKQLPEFEG